MDTESPVLQVDNMIFQGHYAEAPGTNLFFVPGSEDQTENFLTSTTKILRFRRVVLEEKVLQESTDPKENVVNNGSPTPSAGASEASPALADESS